MKKLWVIAVAFGMLAPAMVFADTNHLLISQVQIGGAAANQDFIELFNPTNQPVDLSGWKLRKRTQSGTESSIRVIGEGKVIPAFGFFLWANSADDFATSLGADESSSASLSANNSIALLDPTDQQIDAAAWGSSHVNPFTTEVFGTNPADSESLERNFTDLSWFLQSTPHPRNTVTAPLTPAVDPPPPTDPPVPPPLPSSGGSSAPVYSSAVRISEFLPNPEGTDSGEEWVELFSPEAADLSGWKLDDEGAADVIGSTAFVLPANTHIAANQFLVLIIPENKFALNNSGGDALRLAWPDNHILENIAYSDAAGESQAYARLSTGGFAWTSIITKGLANQFSQAEVEDQEDNQSLNLNPTTLIHINEIMPNPKGPDAGSEWVELKNTGPEPVYIHDWTLDIGDEDSPISKKSYKIQSPTIAPGGIAVLPIPSGKFTMTNTGGTIRLFDPHNILISSISYEAAKEGESYSLIDGEWVWGPPSPDQVNVAVIPEIYSDEIVINELFPEPAKGGEEFIELKNESAIGVNLKDWVLADKTTNYKLPDLVLPPFGIAVIYKTQSQIALNNFGAETVTLENPLGEIVDRLDYEDPPKAQSFSLWEGNWAWSSLATPGAENRLSGGIVAGALLPRTGGGGLGMWDFFVIWLIIWYIYIKLRDPNDPNKHPNYPNPGFAAFG